MRISKCNVRKFLEIAKKQLRVQISTEVSFWCKHAQAMSAGDCMVVFYRPGSADWQNWLWYSTTPVLRTGDHLHDPHADHGFER